MPTSLFLKTINLDLLYPPFLERYLELKTRCRARGANYLSTFGFRSWAESDALHALWKAGKGGRAAPGGDSSHNFGLAGDEALILQEAPRVCRWGRGPPTDEPDDFLILGQEACKLGLHWGVNYGDKPHVSWPGFVSAAELAPLRDIWNGSGCDTPARLQLCWQYVDQHSAVPPFTPSNL